METFKSLVQAVQENNRLNCAQWSDWEGCCAIQDCYGQLKNDHLRKVWEAFLNALVRDNGANLQTYLECMDCLEYGQPFGKA